MFLPTPYRPSRIKCGNTVELRGEVEMSYKVDHLIVAYGSNLNQHDWGKFCRRHGYPINILQFEETVKIPDHKLVFDWYSSSRTGGAANIKRAVGH